MINHPDHLIGYSYSLTPHGAPGSYNEILARHLKRRLSQYRANADALPQVALQWEIADALFMLDAELTDQLNAAGKLLVVQPPGFTAHYFEEKLFEEWLATTHSDETSVLHDCLLAMPGYSRLEQLNSLLSDATLFEKFHDLELDNLTRPTLGELFTEHRTMPRSENYPKGLHQYQCRRINRLIIEKVVSDSSVIPPGRYLSTVGVANHALGHFLKSNSELKTIGIIAHPLHAPRCIDQTLQAISELMPDVQVSNESPEGEIQWDESTAQVWCRSRSNWLQYEKIVAQALAQQRAEADAKRQPR